MHRTTTYHWLIATATLILTIITPLHAMKQEEILVQTTTHIQKLENYPESAHTLKCCLALPILQFKTTNVEANDDDIFGPNNDPLRESDDNLFVKANDPQTIQCLQPQCITCGALSMYLRHMR